MNEIINVYCDESCYLENDQIKTMMLANEFGGHAHKSKMKLIATYESGQSVKKERTAFIFGIMPKTMLLLSLKEKASTSHGRLTT